MSRDYKECANSWTILDRINRIKELELEISQLEKWEENRNKYRLEEKFRFLEESRAYLSKLEEECRESKKEEGHVVFDIDWWSANYLWVLEEWSSTLSMLKQYFKSIWSKEDYYSIRDRLSYENDYPFWKQDLNEWNIAIWSELRLIRDWDKYIIRVTPPILVAKRGFESRSDLTWVIEKECKDIKEIDFWLVCSIIWIESSFWLETISGSWYVWYMQIWENTSLKQLLNDWGISKQEFKEALENNWRNPTNIICWIRYLAYLFRFMDSCKKDFWEDFIKVVLAWYNAWPNRVLRAIENCKKERWWKNAIAYNHIIAHLPEETRPYPEKVLNFRKYYYS